ncbi:hypothetical protein PhCBS80983_g00767 [Powellomyces hirtus]|uniref:FAS1-like dehydratase domain-containing protein n=1 Tax=Powellomyces hirtus TaxID=109895 RepID=A0A507EDL4_9FUNG|nr:hypothetical protein PhCBS80983_g00767 [Powellomyces hirtus]
MAPYSASSLCRAVRTQALSRNPLAWKISPARNVATSSGTATDNVAKWEREVRTKTLIDTDTITAGHAHLLALTLDPSISSDYSSIFAQDRVIPPGFHLALFPPRIPEPSLAPDGYDADFSPPEPFIQRMWAGGSFEFNTDNPLRIGQSVKQTTTLDEAQIKNGPRGQAVMVWQKKLVENQNGKSVVERRCLAYMPAERNPTRDSRTLPIKNTHEFERTICPTPVTLFRYSALTFNSHRIHYDNHYARELEGYPGELTKMSKLVFTV